VEIDERKRRTFDSSEVGLLERDTFVLHVCKDMLVERRETARLILNGGFLFGSHFRKIEY